MEDLARTWIEREALHYGLFDLPVSGEARGTFWSGDYWRLRWGRDSRIGIPRALGSRIIIEPWRRIVSPMTGSR